MSVKNSAYSYKCIRGSREWGDWGNGPPGKSQVALRFFRNTGMDPPREAFRQSDHTMM